MLSRKYLKMVKLAGAVVASAAPRDHGAVGEMVERGVEVDYAALKQATKEGAAAAIACLEDALAQPKGT